MCMSKLIFSYLFPLIKSSTSCLGLEVESAWPWPRLSIPRSSKKGDESDTRRQIVRPIMTHAAATDGQPASGVSSTFPTVTRVM